MPADSAPQSSLRANFFSCLIAGAALFYTLISGTVGPILKHNFVLATQHRPEAFTELYFDSTLQAPLPTSAPAGQKRSFSFHITNHENRRFHYVYHATALEDGRVTPIVTGSVSLDEGASTDITVPFTLTAPNTQAMVTVELEQPAQFISFRSES